MADINKILEEIKGLTVVELNDLVKALETEFGVSAAAMAVAAPAGGAAAAPVEEEKSEYSVVLQEAGGNKIAVIRVVKDATGLGLGEAKALVDGAPSTVKEGLSKAAADEMKKKLEEAGAKVELK